jgi:hypothetical protein
LRSTRRKKEEIKMRKHRTEKEEENFHPAKSENLPIRNEKYAQKQHQQHIFLMFYSINGTRAKKNVSLMRIIGILNYQQLQMKCYGKSFSSRYIFNPSNTFSMLLNIYLYFDTHSTTARSPQTL